jgi:hypothetical protein
MERYHERFGTEGKLKVNSLQDHYDRNKQIHDTVLKCKIRIMDVTHHEIPNYGSFARS